MIKIPSLKNRDFNLSEGLYLNTTTPASGRWNFKAFGNIIMQRRKLM